MQVPEEMLRRRIERAHVFILRVRGPGRHEDTNIFAANVRPVTAPLGELLRTFRIAAKSTVSPADLLEYIALTVSALGNPNRAARLLGAASALRALEEARGADLPDDHHASTAAPVPLPPSITFVGPEAPGANS